MATADELLAKIYANPDDDGLRAVWADALIEQGDPRGEFVALQLSSTRNEARERSLVHKHWKNWVGAICASSVASSRRVPACTCRGRS